MRESFPRRSDPMLRLETDAERAVYRSFALFAVQPDVVRDGHVRKELEHRVCDVVAELRAHSGTPLSPERAYHALRAIALNAGVQVERAFDPDGATPDEASLAGLIYACIRREYGGAQHSWRATRSDADSPRGELPEARS